MTAVGSSAARPFARRIYWANVVAQGLIVVTGAIVRLTGSGLGCPTWPECVDGSITPTSEQLEAWHKYVEFGNRLLTFVLVALAILAIAAAVVDARWRKRAGLVSRPVLIRLAVIPLLGTFVQAVIGGITVLTGLHPATVALHFLVSMAIIAGCVMLVVRATDSGDRPVRWLVGRPVRLLTALVIVATAAIVIVGVLVTGSGPHSGDTGADARFAIDPRVISWIHADVAFAFLGLTVGLVCALLACSGPRRALRIVTAMIAVAAVQVLVGYTQYFSGLPIALVTVHVAGACVLWTLVLFLPGSLRHRGDLADVPTAGDSPSTGP